MASQIEPVRIRIVPAGRDIPLRPGGSAVAGAMEPGPDVVQFDPFLYPPAFSTSINVAVNTAIAGVNTFFAPAGAALTIPNNCFGVVNAIDLMLDGITAASVVNWFLLINGASVPGFAPLTILGRSGAASVSRSWPGPLRIVVPLGGTIAMKIQNVDGAAYVAGTSYYGWFMPQNRLSGGPRRA